MRGLKMINEMTSTEMIDEIMEYKHADYCTWAEVSLRAALVEARARAYKDRLITEAGFKIDAMGGLYLPEENDA